MQRIKSFLKKNTMLIALIVVIILFQVLIIAAGKGSLLKPQNVSNIIAQNSYVVILATGMLLCILTGGNIDLSIGSIVALVGAVAGTLIIEMHVNVYLAIIVCLFVGTFIGAIQAYCIAYVGNTTVYCHTWGYAALARHRSGYSSRNDSGTIPGYIFKIFYKFSAQNG